MEEKNSRIEQLAIDLAKNEARQSKKSKYNYASMFAEVKNSNFFYHTSSKIYIPSNIPSIPGLPVFQSLPNVKYLPKNAEFLTAFSQSSLFSASSLFHRTKSAQAPTKSVPGRCRLSIHLFAHGRNFTNKNNKNKEHHRRKLCKI